MTLSSRDSTLICMAVLCGVATEEELGAMQSDLSNPTSDLGATQLALRLLAEPSRSASDGTSGDHSKSMKAPADTTRRLRAELLSSIDDALGNSATPRVAVFPTDPRPARGPARLEAIHSANEVLHSIRSIFDAPVPAIDIEARLGSQVKDVLARLDPGAPEAVVLSTRYAIVLAANGDTRGALGLLQQQERRLRDTVGAMSKAYVPIFTTRADVLSRLGQTGPALDAMEDAIAQLLLCSGRRDPDLHYTAIDFGTLGHAGDEYEAVKDLCAKQLQWLQDATDLPGFATWTAAVHARLAAVCHDLGDRVGSKDNDAAATQLCQTANVDDATKAQCRVVSAVRLEAERKWRDAASTYIDAAGQYAKHAGATAEKHWADVRVAACLLRSQNSSELSEQAAQNLARLAWRVRHATGPGAKFLAAITQQECALVRLLQGRAREAERWARSALSLLSESGVGNLRQLGEFKARVADTLLEQSRFAEARSMYHEARADLIAAGAKEPLVLWLELRLARCTNGEGDSAAAAVAQQAVARRVVELGIREPILVYEAMTPWVPQSPRPSLPAAGDVYQQPLGGTASRFRPIVRAAPSEAQILPGVEGAFKREGYSYLHSPIVLGQLIRVGLRF